MQRMKVISVLDIKPDNQYIVHEVEYERYGTPEPTITMMTGEELVDYLEDMYEDYDTDSELGRDAFLEYVEEQMSFDAEPELTIYTSEYN